MAVVGIDLGTTNTVVAAVRDGRAAALKDKLGRALLPSVVSFPPKGEPKVGYEGKHRRTLDPENTVFSIKRLIGRSWDAEHVQKALKRLPFQMREGPGKATLVHVQGVDYTLPEISALVLAEAKQIAEDRLGQPVTDAVITVPANFNDLQRAATKVAGRAAGLQVQRILNEPTAAALAYGFGKRGRERIAVYDFGGGTFDVTLLDLSENVFEVLSTAGDTFLGGDDLDRAIMERMGAELLKKLRIDMDTDNLVQEQLRAAAEKLKMDLSVRSMSRIVLEEIGFSGGKPVNFEFTMRRSEFETLAEPFIERTLKVCQEALDVAGVTPKELDEILLVGGSTRIPLVRRRISSFFGKMPQARINPDEVVAIGAAIQASALELRTVTGAPRAPMPASLIPTAPASQPPEVSGVAGQPSATKLGLAGLSPPRPKMDTLSGVGDGPSHVHQRPRPKTLVGIGDEFEIAPDTLSRGGEKRGPRTLTGIGRPPSPEELAKLAAPGASSLPPGTGSDSPGAADADDGPTGRFALSAFDDVTSIIRAPDREARAQDKRAAALDLGSTMLGASAPRRQAPVAVVADFDVEELDASDIEDGSVKFDLAELMAEADLPGLPVVRPDAELPAPMFPKPAAGPAGIQASLGQITEVSGLLEMPDDDFDGELDLPSVSSRPPAIGRSSGTAPRGFVSTRPVSGPGLGGGTLAGLGDPSEADLPRVAAHLPATAAHLPAPGSSLPGVRLASRTPALRSDSGEPRNWTRGLDQTGATGTRESHADLESDLDADFLLDGSGSESTDVWGSQPQANAKDDQQSGSVRGRAADGYRPKALTIDESIDDVLQAPPSAPASFGRTVVLGSRRAEERAAPRPPLLIDVTPLALGVETVGGYVDILIERNSTIPCERKQVFTTGRDHQQVVRIRVSQGDARYFSKNTVLGEVELSGLRSAPRGAIKIDVTFALDESGMLQVSAQDQETGIAASARLKLIGVGE